MVKVHWRLMNASDLKDVIRVASICHPDYPEAEEVLAEKQALSPQTCFILEEGGHTVGYVLAHPWVRDEAPALDKKLEKLPQNANVLYLHDIAILPKARSSGAGGQAFLKLEEAAKKLGFKALALVAVNHSAPYWRKKNFQTPLLNDALKAKLLTYSNDALYMIKDI